MIAPAGVVPAYAPAAAADTYVAPVVVVVDVACKAESVWGRDLFHL